MHRMPTWQLTALAVTLSAATLPAQSGAGRGGVAPPAVESREVVAAFEKQVEEWLHSNTTDQAEYQRLAKASSEAAHALAGLGESGEAAVTHFLKRFAEREDVEGSSQATQKALRVLLFYAEHRTDLGSRPLGGEIVAAARRYTSSDNYHLRGQAYILLSTVDGSHLRDTDSAVVSKVLQLSQRLMMKDINEQLREMDAKGKPVMSAEFTELTYFASAASRLARFGEVSAYRAVLELAPQEKLDATVRLSLVGALGESAEASLDGALAMQPILLDAFSDKNLRSSQALSRAVAELLRGNSKLLIAQWGERKTLPPRVKTALQKILRATLKFAGRDSEFSDLERELKHALG